MSQKKFVDEFCGVLEDLKAEDKKLSLSLLLFSFWDLFHSSFVAEKNEQVTLRRKNQMNFNGLSGALLFSIPLPVRAIVMRRDKGKSQNILTHEKSL